MKCGPYNGCGGYCGFCSDDQYCNSEGYCKKLKSEAGHFIGGMILGIGLVVIGAFGYYFYKKRQSSYEGLA